ncbi:MAG: YhbY family RNA-binding protein [Magnetococcales bacterium]|nr:YhbY family RNA-binding protein [Magnetococcales bacterium]
MLKPNQIKQLKVLGHHLDPVVHVGKDLLSINAVANIMRELDNHELIKIRLNDNASASKIEVKKELESVTCGEVVQMIGKVLLLYKQNPKEPKIVLV